MFHQPGLQESGWQEMSFHMGPLPEAEEMALAAEMLEITNEAELDRFLGGLIRNVGRTLGGIVRSPIGRAIGGVLRPLAKAALPIAGRALGTFVGGPVGGLVGGQLASAAGNLFGLELEGLSPEDREFEVARRFVKFASATTKNALSAPATANPTAVAKAAATAAARRLAPGLLRGGVCPSPAVAAVGIPTAAVLPGVIPTVAPEPGAVPDIATGAPGEAIPAGARRRGTWIRRGQRIVLLGV
jgi:hypothetical protein